VEFGRGIVGRAAKLEEPVVVPDVREKSSYARVLEGVYSGIAVPMKAAGEVVGVLNVESGRLGGFDEREVSVLTALAGQAAVAIRNAQLYAETRNLAERDPLTGLYNYRYFQARLAAELDHAVNNGERLALMIADLDQLKEINDRYGHLQGNRALKTVARVMCESFREQDVLGRIGGDEFAGIMARTEAAQAAAAVRRFTDRMSSSPVTLESGGALSLSVSAGVAIMPEDGRDVGSLIAAADRRMYASKSGYKQ
jgi:diguanylate cyclase (GGDEF)-like protein